ncbi:hypothetical protein [Halobacillus litoralis]|uniref:hypothetical protein n=1 Tax=Halobacillus litoralis TaxID=45668 RepID=UPI001CD7AFFB|nr:hypothetical protein [Halobacillus litoralis]MCA1021617.1 hypothetical protein [Halobacillus litoralis]
MEKVVKLNKRNGIDDINFFLDGLEAEETVKRYRKSIERFVQKLYGIDLDFVQPEHFKKLTYTDMKKYRDYLRRKYVANTVNNEMAGIYSLLKELNRIEVDGEYIYDINVERLKVKRSKVTEIDSSGDISWEETDAWIKHLGEEQVANHERKIAFIHLARITGLRKEALAQLAYKDMRELEDGIWQLRSTLKGKTTEVSIKEQDAQMLLKLRVDEKDSKEKILKMSTKTMERLMDYIKKTFQIPEERKVTIHSLKGLSVYEAYLSSNNSILVAQEHANHSSMETTYSYVKNREKKRQQPSLYMGKDLNEGKVNDLTEDQWKEVYAKLSRAAKYEILQAIEEV